jgi:hypothetical protein
MSRLLNKWFGGSSAPKASPRRPTARLGLEQLDERLLPSATGSISQVVDHNGARVAFFIDQNGVLERSVNGGQAQAVDPWGCHCDQQVSAGTDAFGNAVAYVRNGYGSLWALGWGWGGSLYETHIGDNVSSFSAVMYNPSQGLKGVYGGTQGGVYFIGNGWDLLYQNGNYQGLSGGQYDQQISAGTDENGYSIVYVLNKFNRDVYERNAYGGWSTDLTLAGNQTQVVGSVHGIWYTNDDAKDVFVHSGTGRWSYRFLEGNIAQLSAGADPWGNSTVDLLTTGGEVDKYDNGFGWYSNPYAIAYNAREAAAGDGYDYYVHDFWHDRSSQLHELDWGLNDSVIGYNVQ